MSVQSFPKFSSKRKDCSDYFLIFTGAHLPFSLQIHWFNQKVEIALDHREFSVKSFFFFWSYCFGQCFWVGIHSTKRPDNLQKWLIVSHKKRHKQTILASFSFSKIHFIMLMSSVGWPWRKSDWKLTLNIFHTLF